MPKKNYTKGKAANACIAIIVKLRKLHEDGYISAQKYVKLANEMQRLIKTIK